MSGRDLVLRDKELAQWWNGVAKDTRFDQVINLCKADSFTAGANADSVKGINNFIDLLTHIAENPTPNPSYPTPGLVHEVPLRK